MDIRAQLAAEGLSKEEIDAIVGNEKYAKVMTSALAKGEEGTAALARAAADLEKATKERKDAEDFWETKVTPALTQSDARIAEADADRAQMAAHYLALAERGYDVPAEILEKSKKIMGRETTTTTTTTAQPKGDFLTRAEAKQQFEAAAPSFVTVMTISNRYRDLYGAEYLAGDEDFAEARKAGKPFSQFVAEKYKFTEKTNEKNAAAEQKRIDGIVAEQMKVKEAELATKYGSNGELRAPLASKFDKIEKIAERKDSWKSTKGREESRKARLDRFENVTLQ